MALGEAAGLVPLTASRCARPDALGPTAHPAGYGEVRGQFDEHLRAEQLNVEAALISRYPRGRQSAILGDRALHGLTKGPKNNAKGYTSAPGRPPHPRSNDVAGVPVRVAASHV